MTIQAIHSLNINGRDVPLILRVNRRARRMIVKVEPTTGEVIVTSPSKKALPEALDFARGQSRWIARHLTKVPEKVPLAPGAHIPLRGIMHEIAHQNSLRGLVRVESAGEREVPQIIVPGDAAHLSRRLTDWLKKQAKQDFERAVIHHAQNLSLSPRRISIRDQSSLWGSSSHTGVLSFSWRLILAPEFVLDYIAAHEVAHLQEMNHGPKFWTLVRQTMPRTHEAKVWLKKNGTGLHRYG